MPQQSSGAGRENDLPPHIEDTLAAIVQLHAEHALGATATQKIVARITEELARPRFVGLLTALVLLWMTFNGAAHLVGRRPLDPAPFNFLQGLLTLLAVYMTLLILSTQRRADELAARREQLTLELALLAERKTAKVIELLEELRRDSPAVRDRIDPVAAAMAEPSDPGSILEAFKQSPDDPSNS